MVDRGDADGTGPGGEFVDRTRGCPSASAAIRASSTVFFLAYSYFMTITVRPAGSLPAVNVSVCPS